MPLETTCAVAAIQFDSSDGSGYRHPSTLRGIDQGKGGSPLKQTEAAAPHAEEAE
jgi:hypothetical protein